jgi:23S rRNA (cytosine1962-C5)-methyltransferase
MKLQNWLASIDSDSKKRGVDLFSYCGSWGLNALKAGVQKMSFVDQGNFEECIEKNLKLNELEGKGHFHRADVFKWLKECNQTFDVVISDPPAFSKSLKNKSKALGGYQKLHASLSKIVHKGSWLAIGSCTHGVSLEELDQTVALGFNDSPFELSLVDVGLQGPDHRVSHLSDAGNYIKFLLYRVN